MQTDQDLLKSALSYDMSAGVFRWLEDRVLPSGGIACPSRKGMVAGTTSTGRVCIHFKGRPHLAHRLAWLYVYGEWPPIGIDHIDGDPSNNRFSNLRLADKSQNGQNVHRARVNSKSGKLGVTWNKANKKWVSEVTLNGRRVHCAYHDSLEEAVAVHAIAKSLNHPFMSGGN